jgi:Tol biopolymer transport system component
MFSQATDAVIRTCCAGPATLGLAAILSLGCGDQPSGPRDEPSTGAIRVSVLETGNPLDRDSDGYSVAIDEGPTTSLRPDTPLTIGHVGVGTHLISLGDAVANCSVTGPNPRSVEVPATRTASDGVPVAFIVSCVPKTGNIRVTTTTVGQDQDADGYTVEIGGEGKGRVQANGTVNVEGVREGNWVVSLGDVSGNCNVAPPYTAVANVAFGGTAEVALTVQCVATGGLEVTIVSTGDDYPSSGYDLNAFRLNGPARDSRYARVPANGTVTIPGALAGEYLLVLGQVPQNCVPPDRVVAEVTVGTFTPVTVGVACEGPRQIAFVRGSGVGASIYLIYSNDTGSRQITSTAGANLDPAWSPDGSKIAFASSRDGDFEIYSMGSSGENPVRLTQNPASDSRPAWSPDGSRIAFVSNRDGNAEIYVMNADGTNQLRLTSNVAADSDPDWSPDGARIAFSSEREIGGIWIMNADGSDARRITSNTWGDYQPAWSPDGSKLAFAHGVSATSRDIYFVSSDGSSSAPFLAGLGNATDPSWSPDGRNLAFSALQCASGWYYEYCDHYLLIASADGTRIRSIPQFYESNPAYQP